MHISLGILFEYIVEETSESSNYPKITPKKTSQTLLPNYHCNYKRLLKLMSILHTIVDAYKEKLPDN